MLSTPRTIATLLSRRRSIEAHLESLTPREKEVLRLMVEGLPSRSIASELGISYTTIRTHIRSLVAFARDSTSVQNSTYPLPQDPGISGFVHTCGRIRPGSS